MTLAESVEKQKMKLRFVGGVAESHKPDLPRFYRETIDFSTFRLKFSPPLEIDPCLIVDEQLVALIDERLGIDVFAYTVDELAMSLHEEIEMLWLNYAEADDEMLTSKAIELKLNLTKRIQKVNKHG